MLFLLLLLLAAVGNEINTNIFHMELLYHCGSLAKRNGKRYRANIGLPFRDGKRCVCAKPFHSGAELNPCAQRLGRLGIHVIRAAKVNR